MIRVSSVLAALVAASVLLPAAAAAQCSAADRCSASQCQSRQSQVHAACDTPRSCSAIPPGNKVELRRRLAINQNCLAVRASVNECFSQTDRGHAQQLSDVRNAIARCEEKIRQ